MTTSYDIKLSAATLAKAVNDMANRHEAPGNYVKAEGTYTIELRDMAGETELSYVAYLLLTHAWNDALDWAKDPSTYVGQDTAA